MALTGAIQLITVTLLAFRVPRIRKALFMPDSRVFSGWREYLGISVPATIMICAEWWAFELFVVASSYLGVDQLAANVVMQNIAFLMFMFPQGFLEGICCLVGSSIGADNVPLARRIFKLTFGFSYGLCMCVSILVFTCRH
jgi:multidrug resistance protein, MATE family